MSLFENTHKCTTNPGRGYQNERLYSSDLLLTIVTSRCDFAEGSPRDLWSAPLRNVSRLELCTPSALKFSGRITPTTNCSTVVSLVYYDLAYVSSLQNSSTYICLQGAPRSRQGSSFTGCTTILRLGSS